MSDQVTYTVGGTVQASGGIYISREADEELLRLYQADEFCYVLTPRQMGKSSLMVATMERLAAEDIHSVEIDLTKMGTKLSGLTAEQWYLGLIEFIVDQLDLDVDYVAWWDEHAHLGPTQRWSQFLRQVVLEQVPEPVVIFIDEIDSTLNFDFRDDFFAAIRACYNARASDPAFKRLSFVLLGVATPSDLISDPQRTPFNIGRRVDLTDFTERQAIPLAAGLGLPPGEAGQIMTWILDWTGGHPYLTQRLCAAAAASPTKNWNAAAVNKLVEKTFLGEQSAQDDNLRFVRDMLTKRAPDKVAVLKTYRRIRAGKAVPDEERSPVKTHLKLSGIVKRKGDNLIIRSRIYEQVFNQGWIGQNIPQDWARRIAVVSTLLVLLLGSLLGYYNYRQGQQTIEARAQAFIDSFRGTTSADVRITSLAGLFQIPGYEDRARALFFDELAPEDQVTLFEKADVQAVGDQLIIVVQGLYIHLDDSPAGNQLLRVMAQTLRKVDGNVVAKNLATEIEQWLVGRDYAAQEDFQYAVEAYDTAIELNPDNIGTHFDRALAYTELGGYQEALTDFDTVLEIVSRARPTPTPTSSPTLSSEDSPSPSLEVTSTSTPVSTLFDSPIFHSPISPPTPVSTPTHVVTATVSMPSSSVQRFTKTEQIAVRVEETILRNTSLLSALSANQSRYSNLSRITSMFEGFEAGVVPPSGWTLIQTNPNQTWKLDTSGLTPYAGNYYAAVKYDPALLNQDELLVSPTFTADIGYVNLWSFGSLYWCRDTYDNCDLEVWFVNGSWGGGDDVLLGEIDNDWSGEWEWSYSTFDFSPYTSRNPARIALRYVGNGGAKIGVDDILIAFAE